MTNQHNYQHQSERSMSRSAAANGMHTYINIYTYIDRYRYIHKYINMINCLPRGDVGRCMFTIIIIEINKYHNVPETNKINILN